jgi:hypothetical protein
VCKAGGEAKSTTPAVFGACPRHRLGGEQHRPYSGEGFGDRFQPVEVARGEGGGVGGVGVEEQQSGQLGEPAAAGAAASRHASEAPSHHGF